MKVQLTSYRASISRPVLRMFVTLELVPATKVDEITEAQLAECIKNQTSVSKEDYDLAEIERDLMKVKMGHNRVW